MTSQRWIQGLQFWSWIHNTKGKHQRKTFKCIDNNKNHEKEFDNHLANRLQVNRYLAKILATSLLDKKELHSSLAIENITNTDYKHVERAWEDFGIQNLGLYYNLYE